MEKVLKKFVLPILSIIAIVGLDQWTKFLTLKYIQGTDGFYIIDRVLRICFVKNEGMAWGMLQNKQVLFIVLTPIVIAGLVYVYYKLPFEKKYIPMRICDIFLAGGAVGNFIDRLFRGEKLCHGYVVDMIYVEIIDFPVFNIADSFITVGFAMLIVLMLFVYKESDFDLIFGTKNKKKEIINEEAVTENENN